MNKGSVGVKNIINGRVGLREFEGGVFEKLENVADVLENAEGVGGKSWAGVRGLLCLEGDDSLAEHVGEVSNQHAKKLGAVFFKTHRSQENQPLNHLERARPTGGNVLLWKEILLRLLLCLLRFEFSPT